MDTVPGPQATATARAIPLLSDHCSNAPEDLLPLLPLPLNLNLSRNLSSLMKCLHKKFNHYNHFRVCCPYEALCVTCQTSSAG